VCAAIDGFRARYGRWPVRVRLFAGALDMLRGHVLTPEGIVVVESVVQLIADDSAPMIAEGAAGESYNYGEEGFSQPQPEESTQNWFGQAILRADLRE
jgi:hypothetical protein